MDAVEFVKQLRRMDKSGVRKNHFIYPFVGRETASPEDVVAEVEEWGKENPVKTRQSEFLKQWPNVATFDDGMIKITPCNLDLNIRRGCLGVACEDCRREFWTQEVE